MKQESEKFESWTKKRVNWHCFHLTGGGGVKDKSIERSILASGEWIRSQPFVSSRPCADLSLGKLNDRKLPSAYIRLLLNLQDVNVAPKFFFHLNHLLCLDFRIQLKINCICIEERLANYHHD